MTSINELVGARLRELRVMAGVTQAELGRMVGLSRPSVTNIEKGRQQVSVELLVELAAALGVSPENLIPLSDGPASPAIGSYTSELTEEETRWVHQVINDVPHQQPA